MLFFPTQQLDPLPRLQTFIIRKQTLQMKDQSGLFELLICLDFEKSLNLHGENAIVFMY